MSSHRTANAREDVHDRGAESVPGRIHRGLKLEADLQQRGLLLFLHLISCLCARSLAGGVLPSLFKFTLPTLSHSSKTGYLQDLEIIMADTNLDQTWSL